MWNEKEMSQLDATLTSAWFPQGLENLENLEK